MEKPYQPPRLFYTFNYGKYDNSPSFNDLLKELSSSLEQHPHLKVELIIPDLKILKPQDKHDLETLINTHNSQVIELSKAEWQAYYKELLK